MAAFDFDEALRWVRFKTRRSFVRRPDSDLSFITDAIVGGGPLLLDTCVYIDQLRGVAPILVERLIETRLINHSTVVVQELMHSVGALDPTDPRTKRVVAAIGRQVRAMRPYRIFAPDPDVLGKAPLLAGALCRIQRYAADRRIRALQDCVLFLQASKLGLSVLTANVADFDILLQMIPTGRVLFYRNR